jgi:hypothetical protein
VRGLLLWVVFDEDHPLLLAFEDLEDEFLLLEVVFCEQVAPEFAYSLHVEACI